MYEINCVVSVAIITLQPGMSVSQIHPQEKKTSDFHKDDCDRGNVSGMYLLLF